MSDLLVFVGNCQAQYLAAVLDGLAGARAIYYGVGYGAAPSFEGLLSRSLHGDGFRRVVGEARARGDRVVVVEQRHMLAPSLDLGLEPSFTAAFPHVICYALFPAEFCRDHGLARAPRTRRLFELDLHRMAKVQKSAGYATDIAGFIESRLPREVLFTTPGHLTGTLSALVLEGLLDQLAGFDARYGGSDLVERIRHHEGMNWVTSHPIDAAVQEQLGLDWGEPYRDFCRLVGALWNEKALGDDIPDLIARNRDRYADNTIYWFCAAAHWWQRGDVAPALDASRECVRLQPGHGGMWLGLQTRLFQSGHRAEADAVLDEVRQIFGDRFELDGVLAALLNNVARYEQALPHAVNHFRNMVYHPEYLAPLAEALSRLGRFDEMAKHRNTAEAHYPDLIPRIEQIIAPLAQQPIQPTETPNSLRDQITIEWSVAPYYEEAEAESYMQFFWGPDSRFFAAFRQLDLTETAELACGHGRHTQFIVDHYRFGHITLLDVNQTNIDWCNERFAGDARVSCFVNSGFDLPQTETSCLTSLFCYDAMVHFEYDDVFSYIRDMARVLKPGAMALIHHSNNDEQPGNRSSESTHWRNFMSAPLFKHVSMRHGFRIVRQEVMDWRGEKDIDCLTLMQKLPQTAT